MTLVTVTLGGVFVWAGHVLLIVIGALVLESMNILPNLWVATHVGIMLLVGSLISVPAIVFVATAMLRRAITVEKEEREAEDKEEGRPEAKIEAASAAEPAPAADVGGEASGPASSVASSRRTTSGRRPPPPAVNHRSSAPAARD
ncbi:MAG: hypothetical protein A3J29_17405 [Acidobacteria bacterium RIFCSPLOWO2_12_FULL_67_14b]|nr:MAG: hypothetical protein A3J29_17405 [Acidobacteria bacterium RIFCSPLOWO2_12_FULL_67_14b]